MEDGLKINQYIFQPLILRGSNVGFGEFIPLNSYLLNKFQELIFGSEARTIVPMTSLSTEAVVSSTRISGSI